MKTNVNLFVIIIALSLLTVLISGCMVRANDDNPAGASASTSVTADSTETSKNEEETTEINEDAAYVDEDKIMAGIGTLTDEQISELVEVGFIEPGEQIYCSIDEDNYYKDKAKRYYGTFQDCIVLADIKYSDTMTAGQEKIAGRLFLCSEQRFYLYVYRDGVLYDLNEAYERGFLNDDDINTIFIRHTLFEGFDLHEVEEAEREYIDDVK